MRIIYLLAIAITICVASTVSMPALASDLGDITLLAQHPIPDAGFITDVWGYIDPATNKEYALVGTSRGTDGFFVVDVTDPVNPVTVKQAVGGRAFDLKVFDHYVYTNNGFTSGNALVWDIANPAAPSIVGAFESSHNMAVDQRGFLYLSDAGSQHELKCYDLRTTPNSPSFLWGDGVNNAHDASVVGNRLYDFHGVNGTRIYDVTDHLNAVLLGTITDPGIVFHHSGYPTKDGNYVFICDELALHPSSDVTVWDIQDPANPFKVAEFADTSATVHNLYIIDDYAYISYYSSGFKVFDVSDPTNPQLADEWDTSASIFEGFSGAFGVYPFTPSGNIYISDEDNGLFVFDFTPGTATAVAFAFVEATYNRGAVDVSWDIQHADGLRGFQVLRSADRGAHYESLTPTLLSPTAETLYRDTDVEPATEYWYQVRAIDDDGEFLSPPAPVTTPDASVRLLQNAPNPFNPSTTITFELSFSSHAVLEVVNARGQVVRTLARERLSGGPHAIDWDGTDNRGARAASGVYFCRLSVDGRTHSRRMILLK